MAAEFFRVLDDSLAARLPELGLSLHQAVTLASIVEGEAMAAEERPVISAIFHRRLSLDRRLESCATVEFALGVQKPRLTNEDLEVVSPYNTYRHSGLPPGPICNPGRASLEAALHPPEDRLLLLRRPRRRHPTSSAARTASTRPPSARSGGRGSTDGGRPPRRAEPGTTPGRRAALRSPAGPRRRRVGQDPGPHPPHRPPRRRGRGGSLAHPRRHLHQQGRRRDARARRGPRGRGVRGKAVGRHLPLDLRAPPALRGVRLRPPRRLHDLRRRGLPRPDAPRPRQPRPGREGLPSPAGPRRDQPRQERHDRPRGVRPAVRRQPPPPPAGRGVLPGTRRGCGPTTPSISTTSSSSRCASCSATRRCWRSGGSAGGHILVDEYQDTNRPPVPAHPAAGRRAPQPLRRRRRRPVDLPVPRRRHPQHPRLREGLPRGRGRAPGAELPLHQPHPRRRQRRHRPQPRPQGQEPVDPRRGGPGDPAGRVRRRPGRGAPPRRRRARPLPRGGAEPLRRRRSLPRQRPVPRPRGGAAAPGGSLRPGGGHPLLRAPRGEGCPRLPAAAGQPGRRHQPPEGDQHPEARHRRPHGGEAGRPRAAHPTPA